MTFAKAYAMMDSDSKVEMGFVGSADRYRVEGGRLLVKFHERPSYAPGWCHSDLTLNILADRDWERRAHHGVGADSVRRRVDDLIGTLERLREDLEDGKVGL